MNRKDFIKATCTVCIGLHFFPLQDAHATAKKTYKAELLDGYLVVPITELDKQSILKVRNKNLDYDILVVKESDHYTCLNMKCSHEGVPVSLSGDKLHCSAHGSIFDLGGNVLLEPAIKPLEKFTYTIINNNLNIKI